MRVADQAAWDRDFPVRHLLVREDEDGETEYWGRCAGVEGLFLDKVPPPREVLTLHGCTPTGALRDALSPAGERTGLLGDVCVEVWDEQQPLQWWTLIDTVVLACRPNRGDPALVDVVVGAGVEEEHAWQHTLPASAQYRLLARTSVGVRPVGHCTTASKGSAAWPRPWWDPAATSAGSGTRSRTAWAVVSEWPRPSP